MNIDAVFKLKTYNYINHTIVTILNNNCYIPNLNMFPY